MTVDQRVYFLTTEAKRMLRKTEANAKPSVSYILRLEDAEFWRRVKAKAALEGVSIKVLLVLLLTRWLAETPDAAGR